MKKRLVKMKCSQCSQEFGPFAQEIAGNKCGMCKKGKLYITVDELCVHGNVDGECPHCEKLAENANCEKLTGEGREHCPRDQFNEFDFNEALDGALDIVHHGLQAGIVAGDDVPGSRADKDIAASKMIDLAVDIFKGNSGDFGCAKDVDGKAYVVQVTCASIAAEDVRARAEAVAKAKQQIMRGVDEALFPENNFPAGLSGVLNIVGLYEKMIRAAGQGTWTSEYGRSLNAHIHGNNYRIISHHRDEFLGIKIMSGQMLLHILYPDLFSRPGVDEGVPDGQ